VDTLADGSGTATLTWLSKEILNTNKIMNPALVTNADGTYQEGTGSIGGWEKTEMRTYLKETIKPLMLEVVRNSIKEVTKTHNAYNTAGTIFTQTTNDDVWLPDYNEIFGSSRPYKSMFPNAASRKKSKVGETSVSYWWLRSANNTSNFYYVNNSGIHNNHYANYPDGVAFGFCT
jgi:hypothetical protein